MGRSEYDPCVKNQRPWNAGRKIVAKRALKPQQVWAIRFWLDREQRLRDRTMFDLAIDSKLRGCDIVKMKIGDIVSGGQVRSRAIVFSRKLVGRSSSNSLNLLAQAFLLGSNAEEARSTTSYFPVGSITPSISVPASMHVSSMNG